MTEFLTVVVLHLFAVISPGPDFALISRQSIRYGRKIAIWSAAGIGMGILFHSLLAISGIIIVISANELYFSLVKLFWHILWVNSRNKCYTSFLLPIMRISCIKYYTFFITFVGYMIIFWNIKYISRVTNI